MQCSILDEILNRKNHIEQKLKIYVLNINFNQ